MGSRLPRASGFRLVAVNRPAARQTSRPACKVRQRRCARRAPQAGKYFRRTLASAPVSEQGGFDCHSHSDGEMPWAPSAAAHSSPPASVTHSRVAGSEGSGAGIAGQRHHKHAAGTAEQLPAWSGRRDWQTGRCLGQSRSRATNHRSAAPPPMAAYCGVDPSGHVVYASGERGAGREASPAWRQPF